MSRRLKDVVAAALRPRGKQARSEATYERIVNAAEKLFLEKGADVPINEIVRAAKSSVGGFYARFRDKNDLLRAVYGRVIARDYHLIDMLLDEAVVGEGAKLEDVVVQFVTAYTERIEERYRFVAAMLGQAVSDAEHWHEATSIRESVQARVATFLSKHFWDDVNHADPENAIRFAMRTVVTLTDVRALAMVSEGPEQVMPLDAYRQELVRLVIGYLRGAS